jgi:hypothetical protein
LAVVVVAATSIVAACSGGDGDRERVITDEDPVDLLRAASEKAAEATSYRLDGRVEVESGPCSVLFDRSDADVEAEIQVRDGVSTARVTDRETGHNAIRVEPDLYVPAEVFGDRLEVDTPWVRIGPEDEEALDALAWTAPGLAMFGGEDEDDDDQSPTLAAMLEELRLSADDVQEVGREDVRGDEATRYRIEGGQIRDMAEDSESMEIDLEGLDDEIDAWVNDDGFVVRIEVRTPEIARDRITFVDGQMRIPSPFDVPSTHLAYEVWDHGRDFDIRPPADDDVTPADELDFSGVDTELDESELPAECLPDLEDFLGGEDGEIALDDLQGEWIQAPRDDGLRTCFEDAGLEVALEPPDGYPEPPTQFGDVMWRENVGPEDPRWEGYLGCLDPQQADFERCMADSPLFGDLSETELEDDEAGPASCFSLLFPPECQPDPSAPDDPAPPDECANALFPGLGSDACQRADEAPEDDAAQAECLSEIFGGSIPRE